MNVTHMLEVSTTLRAIRTDHSAGPYHAALTDAIELIAQLFRQTTTIRRALHGLEDQE